MTISKQVGQGYIYLFVCLCVGGRERGEGVRGRKQKRGGTEEERETGGERERRGERQEKAAVSLCYGELVTVRAQLSGVDSLLPHRTQGSNLGP